MRTKTLLLTAALGAAGLLPSTAQVFSVNQVGYVRQVIPAGRQAILTNPLNGTPDNRINTILPLPNNAGYAGAAVFRYDSELPGFKDGLLWFDDFGWYSPTEENPELPVGEGFFFRAPAGRDAELTYIGNVPLGLQPNAIPSANKLAFRGSTIPWQKQVGDTTLNAAGTMQFPARPGDQVTLWDPNGGATQYGGYTEPFLYFDGYGWNAATGDQGPAGPAILPGTGFSLRSADDGSPARTWSQTYTP